LAELHSRLPAKAFLVLTTDQFEEAFTLCRDEDLRQTFLNALLAMSNSHWIKVICTLRADFFHYALGWRELSEQVTRGQVNVLPMTDAERKEAIEQPAFKLGRQFQQGLSSAFWMLLPVRLESSHCWNLLLRSCGIPKHHRDCLLTPDMTVSGKSEVL